MNDAAHREFKDRLFQQLARVGKALASPRRLEIVDLLAQGERTVEDLARLTGMSMANTSQHLKALRGALLVASRRQGAFCFYRLSDDGVLRAWVAIRSLGQAQFAEIDRLLDRFVSHRKTLESVTSRELLARIRRKDVVVVDVRPAVEFAAGHIVGARSIPVREIEKRLEEIPKSREIVAYCRGPFCVYADEAVLKLKRRGYRARRLDVGYPDWKDAGLPTAM
jgi:rhodanese-related sulfurtransferase